MGGAYSMYGGGEEVHTGFLWGNMRERDLGIDWRAVLKSVLKKWLGWGEGQN